MEGTAPKIVERHCKTALSKTEVASYDYTVNPYTGCLHGCVYMRRFSGHLQDPWGSFVDVKVNLLDVLAKELPKRLGGRVWFSSVCDPYQQVEAKYKLTRGAIELISKYQKLSVSILTKNALVLRDLEILESMKHRVDIGFTITTFSPEAQPFFEPRASAMKDRIEALRRLNESGLDTWVFIAPILPHVTEVALDEGLRQLAEAGVKRLITDRYNARGMVINRTLEAYRSWNPQASVEEIRRLLWKGDEYYRRVDAKVSRLWKKAARGTVHEKVF